MKDLIKNSFIENINVKILHKNFRVIKIVLVLLSIYSVCDIVDWCVSFQNFYTLSKSNLAFYNYRIRPFIAILILALNIIGFTFIFKGNKLIITSIEKEDAAKFNEGYSTLYKSSLLSMAGYCTAIASIIMRIILKH